MGFFCAFLRYFCYSCLFLASRVLESLYRWSNTLMDLLSRGATVVSSMVKLYTLTDLFTLRWLLLMFGVNLHSLNYLFSDYSKILFTDYSFFFLIFTMSCYLLILLMIYFDIGLMLGLCRHYLSYYYYFCFCLRLIHNFLAFYSINALSYRLSSRLLRLVYMVE